MRDALTGNEAIAHGVRLSRIGLTANYPITPQTVICETLTKFIADGSLKAAYVNSESEHGSVATVIGAASTGVRTFISTCSQGFALGFENIAWAPGVRLPIVMAVVNRSLSMPLVAGCDHSDSMTARDLGWVQLYVESNQEALDTIIQAYRIAEDSSVLLPAMVCMDGFTVSHTTEAVEIPSQDVVDAYLPVKKQEHIVLDPNRPMQIQGPMLAEPAMAYVWLQNQALLNASGVVRQANDEFLARFGRGYGNGLVEKVECDDADVVLVTIGSMAGNARDVVRNLRREGKRVGLARIRCFRPFPREDILAIARQAKVIAVLDRNLSRGLDEGACCTEVKSVLYGQGTGSKVMGFIVGLHGVEARVEDISYIANRALAVAEGTEETTGTAWVPRIDVTVLGVAGDLVSQPEKAYYPGTRDCPGCPLDLAFRHVMDRFDRNVVLLRTMGCPGWTSTKEGSSAIGVPVGRTTLPAGCACATGISLGLRQQGKDDTQVVLFGGDGSVTDMGFAALSGAAERNEDFICIVQDNEAYANTGIQRSGTTPHLAWTTTTPIGSCSRGKDTGKKDVPLIVAAHRVPYVATVSLAYLDDLRKKIDAAQKIKGFRYIHVHSPCPTSWRFPPEEMIKVARRAVLTGIHKLYEIREGKLSVTVKPEELLPVTDYLGLQERYAHLSGNELEAFQQEVTQSWQNMLKWEGCGVTVPF
ncbi:MAG: hypothetical protein HY675_23945 [Chloroflexi bacterium]|nr:hypothetical protein [Chloroflexota bacterium]